jgi:hypothetical protein
VILYQKNVFILCAGQRQKFREDTDRCDWMERLLKVTFKYWLNALSRPAKLVRLAVNR